MYIMLVQDDNQIVTTKRERIVQRSKMCDIFCIYIPIIYKGMDMQDFEVTMFYELPISHEKVSVVLTKEDDLYKNQYMVYKINADTNITKEFGTVEFSLSMTKVEMGANNKPIQYVRKATGGLIEIASSRDWGSELADPLLESLDQRIIQLQMLAKQQEEASQYLYEHQANDLHLTDDLLQLSANSKVIGDGVKILVPGINDADYDKKNDGILDLNNIEISDDSEQDETPEFIELG